MTPIAAPFVDAGADALLARIASPRRALFLDRDGVVNVDHGYVHKPEDVAWVPGIFGFVRAAWDAGFLPIVVTNQAGIARGYYDEATFRAFTAWMHLQFAERGAPLLATYFCPHHPDAGLGALRVACECRKPAPGMLRAAIGDFALDAGASMLIGDKAHDIAAARAAGVGQALQFILPGDDEPIAGIPVHSLKDATARIARAAARPLS